MPPVDQEALDRLRVHLDGQFDRLHARVTKHMTEPCSNARNAVLEHSAGEKHSGEAVAGRDALARVAASFAVAVAVILGVLKMLAAWNII